MTGENNRRDLPPQPGGRAPAPGELALVQAFINTHYDLTAESGGEVLVDPSALCHWCASWRLMAAEQRVSKQDLERALAVREGLRALAFANNGQGLNDAAVDAMRQASEGASTRIRIDPEGPRFAADTPAGIDGAISALLTIAARSMIEGRWKRLKACPGRHCGWAFYDSSRNQSARWCSMKVCGDREKARAYYERKTEHSSA